MQPLRLFLSSAWTSFRSQSRRTQAIIAAVAAVVLVACCGISAAIGNAGNTTTTGNNSTANTHTSAVAHATATARPRPTATPQAIYPPKTKADLDALAALGDTSVFQTFDSENTGLAGVCPEPRREMTVSPGITGKQLAEDLLAYFYSQQLDTPCGSLELAYHSQSESDGSYTAGRINLDVTDASGQGNTDPNATNLTYTVTIDLGDVVTNQEYIVTYTH